MFFLHQNNPVFPKMLRNLWPKINGVQGQLATIYRPVFEKYEKLFERRFEILLIETLKSKREKMPDLDEISERLKSDILNIHLEYDNMIKILISSLVQHFKTAKSLHE